MISHMTVTKMSHVTVIITQLYVIQKDIEDSRIIMLYYMLIVCSIRIL